MSLSLLPVAANNLNNDQAPGYQLSDQLVGCRFTDDHELGRFVYSLPILIITTRSLKNNDPKV